MAWMSLAESLRDQDLNVLADEVLSGESEQPFQLRVDRSNAALGIGYSNRVRRSFE
jgi:hypothetical protein